MLTELFLQRAFTVVVTGKPLKQDIEGMPKCDVGYKANLKWAMKDILGDQWLMASYRTKKSFVCAVHCLAIPVLVKRNKVLYGKLIRKILSANLMGSNLLIWFGLFNVYTYFEKQKPLQF